MKYIIFIKDSPDTFSYECKPCILIRNRTWSTNNPDESKNRKLKWHYGISVDDYNKTLISQNCNCAICGRNQSEFKKALSVDHNHVTGAVRGLLCGDCNRALGMMNENTGSMVNMINYIKKWNI